MVAEFTELGKNHDSLEKLRDALISLTTSLAGVNERVFDLVTQREQLNTEIEGYRQAVVDLHNQDDTGIQNRITELVALHRKRLSRSRSP